MIGGLGRFAAGSFIIGLLVLSGCAGKDVGPINLARADLQKSSPEFIPDAGDDGSTIIGLAFSGGGMRASAFSYGVLRALDDMVVDEVPYRRTMVDNIRMISGVSGGAVVAAYFGAKGRDAYRDLDQRFLYQNPEASMRTSALSPVAISRAISGGVNDRNSFARWLDDNLFDGAKFSSLKWPNAPTVWINASDIYNRTPFLFTHDTFAALCSDLDSVRIADAVGASAAVPVVFTPVVLEATKPDCNYAKPKWLTRALEEPDVSVRLEAYARTLKSYQGQAGLNYVKLLDGGLTDNLGITGFVLERSASLTPHGPLSAEQAVKAHNLLFIIADAGQGQTGTWAAQIHGPTIAPLVQASIRTSMESSVRDEMDALKLAIREWRGDLVRYRCGLSRETVRRIRGTLAGWKCDDIDIVVEHLTFTDLGPDAARNLSEIPTRLALSRGQVDTLVDAGRKAANLSRPINDALRTIRGRAGVKEPMLIAAE